MSIASRTKSSWSRIGQNNKYYSKKQVLRLAQPADFVSRLKSGKAAFDDIHAYGVMIYQACGLDKKFPVPMEREIFGLPDRIKTLKTLIVKGFLRYSCAVGVQ